MAIYHCSTKPLARSPGRSALASAAYRSGDRLVDERQGLEHDYTRRSGVVHSELVLPEGAGTWSRAELWNAGRWRWDSGASSAQAAGESGGKRAGGRRPTIPETARSPSPLYC
jgi:hypothetical protein